jgi:hypothetical protein
MKYQHTTKLTRFFLYHFGKKERITKLMLTADKLNRLMERIASEEIIPIHYFSGEEKKSLHRRNKLLLEKCDVVVGLEVYINKDRNPENLEHLKNLYSKLPHALKNLDLTDEKNNLVAAFEDEPAAGILYHKVDVLRNIDDINLANIVEQRFLKRYRHTKFAKVLLKGA